MFQWCSNKCLCVSRSALEGGGHGHSLSLSGSALEGGGYGGLLWRVEAMAVPWGCVSSVTALCRRLGWFRAGSPFTLYRDLACLSKWSIKMSYYQSHADSIFCAFQLDVWGDCFSSVMCTTQLVKRIERKSHQTKDKTFLLFYRLKITPPIVKSQTKESLFSCFAWLCFK